MVGNFVSETDDLNILPLQVGVLAWSNMRLELQT